MTTTEPDQHLMDPVLSRFRRAVTDHYGDRIERVLLFGSRARGEAQSESDYDVAVFLRDMTDRAREKELLADIGTDILYDLGRIVHAIPFEAGSLDERSPLMGEIRRDRVAL